MDQRMTGRTLRDKLNRRALFEGMLASLYQQAADRFSQFGLASDAMPLYEFVRQEKQHASAVKEYLDRRGRPIWDPRARRQAMAEAKIFEDALCSHDDPVYVLRVLLVAELEDEGGWDHVIELARASGRSDLSKVFGRVLAEERLHLMTLRALISRLARAAVAQPSA